MKERIEKLVKGFDKLNIDGLIVTNNESRFHLSGFKSTDGTLLITKKEAVYIADFRYIEEVQKKVSHMRAVKCGTNVIGDIASCIQELGIARLGFEESVTTYAQHKMMEKKFEGVELVPVGALATNLRIVKDERELALIRKAQSITDAAFADIIKFIKVGMTEKEVETELIMSLYRNGATGLAFDCIVVSGANSALPHGKATDKVIENGDFLTMDFGAKFGGYCSDMTRTVAIGSVTPEMLSVYNKVLEAQLAAIAAIRPNLRGCDIDKVARDIITDAGYGDNFGHGLGHSFGILVHENPRFSPPYVGEVPEGALMTIEPGIYLPGKFGVRIEDDIIVTADGCENITKSTKELLIL